MGHGSGWPDDTTPSNMSRVRIHQHPVFFSEKKLNSLCSVAILRTKNRVCELGTRYSLEYRDVGMTRI